VILANIQQKTFFPFSLSNLLPKVLVTSLSEYTNEHFFSRRYNQLYSIILSNDNTFDAKPYE